MASKSTSFADIASAIKKGNLAPVYLLHGEEGYFIDRLVKMFEEFYPVADREFCLFTLYGPQTSMGAVMDVCRQFPMMTDRQLVILKETQALRAGELDKLAPYINNPADHTTLVICSRGASAKGKAFLDSVKHSDAVVFDSKRVPEYQIASHIQKLINEAGLTIDAKALEMLKNHVGTDLSRLYNEIEKLITVLGPGAMVTPEAVERNVGISKDYNAFELVEALAVKDAEKAFRICDYFAANPKGAPTVLVVAAVFNFFADLLITYFEKDQSEHGLMQALGLKSTFPLKRIRAARSKYNAYQVIEIIRAIRNFDVNSKGFASRQNEYALLRELVFHILTAPGNLWQQ